MPDTGINHWSRGKKDEGFFDLSGKEQVCNSLKQVEKQHWQERDL